jgi:hypothetical protein
VIGVVEAEPVEAELVEPALVLELVLPLLLLLLQAARTPTESATALMVMTFLENQGKVNLTPGSSFLLGQGLFGVEPADTSACSLSRVIPADSVFCAINAAKSTSP